MKCKCECSLGYNINSALNMSRGIRKRSFGHVSPVKIQISLRIPAVIRSLGAFWIPKDAKFLNVDN